MWRDEKIERTARGRPTLHNIFAAASLMTRLFLYGVWGGYRAPRMEFV